MSSYSLFTLAGWLGADPLVQDAASQDIGELLYDSRRLNHASKSLFVALHSRRNDGHRYIPGLIDKGVRNFLVERIPEGKLSHPANFIRVDNTLEALQTLATRHRSRFTYPVTGITGSNGKTIVKEWLYELLREDFNIVRSPKSFNSQLGVPLSLWQLDETHQLALIEAGISLPGEMQRLEAMIRPDIGIFTNIGSAHSKHFSDQAALVQEKLVLFRRAGLLIYCRDHEAIHEQIGLMEQRPARLSSWGEHPDAAVKVKRTGSGKTATQLQITREQDTFTLDVPFSDAASIENALHCVVMLLELGLAPETIRERLPRLHPVEMRLELRRGIHGCTLVNDAYSADPESLQIALDYLSQQRQSDRRTVILSDILESGKSTKELYDRVAGLLNRKQVHRLIGVGSVLLQHMEAFEGEKLFFPTTEKLLEQLPGLPFRNENILIKGARVFGFERIADALQQKTHETVLEVNLSAMVHNLNHYRSLLPPGTKTMAMVKAFAYGSGSAEIANVLQSNGVDYLAVAYADEGTELRQAGITLPVMVMNPEPESFVTLIDRQLEPELYSFRLLDLFAAAVRERSGFDGQPVRVHLKLDTGMHRLGFEEKDLPGLIPRIREQPGLEVASVFSHLAAGGEPEHDDFTRLQLTRFGQWTAQLEAGLGTGFLRHILNSAGIVRHPAGTFDMVRLGIGLYGIGGEEQAALENVETLKTVISQIRELAAGETVGYSRRGILSRPARIATLPIGYADGFLRKLGNGNGHVRIRGRYAPTIGSICMDMCMVDVTDIPDAHEGDRAIVFDSPAGIKQLAAQLDTIPYEVLTGISGRVKRVYYQE